jgi:hypothetical protein
VSVYGDSYLERELILLLAKVSQSTHIVSGCLCVDDRGLFPGRVRRFSLGYLIHTGPEIHPASHPTGTGGSLPMDEATGDEVAHLFQSSVEVKNTATIRLRGMVFN